MIDWGRVLEVALVVIMIPAVGWGLKTLLDVRQSVSDLKTALIGIDGANGMRSDIRELKKRVERLEEAA